MKLLSNKKEQTTVIHTRLKLELHSAKSKKPNTKEYLLHNSISTKFYKRQIQSVVTESRSVVPWGWGKRIDWEEIQGNTEGWWKRSVSWFYRYIHLMDGGAWWAAVHGVAKSWTQLSDFTFTFRFHALEEEMATHSSVLAWRIPRTGEPGGLPSMGSHRVGHD